jgi:Mg-chelatase subunit ChlD
MSSTIANNFELNKGDQFIVALDISGSMQMKDCPGNASRFSYVLETMEVFISEASKWDPDGVSFYAFNNEVQEFPDVASTEALHETIGRLRPGGGTATHRAISAAYREHKLKGSEQTFLLLFTDGEPSDRQAVKQAIVDITNDVKDEKEFRICILTVGARTPELSAWLSDLDDNLTEAKYDIVDIEKLEDVDFERAVANAIEG